MSIESNKKSSWTKNSYKTAKVLSKLSCTIKSENLNKIQKRSNVSFAKKRPWTAPPCPNRNTSHFCDNSYFNSRQVSTTTISSKYQEVHEYEIPYKGLKFDHLKASAFDYKKEAQYAGNRPYYQIRQPRPLTIDKRRLNNKQVRKNDSRTPLNYQELRFST
jgi:hypothetical protein